MPAASTPAPYAPSEKRRRSIVRRWGRTALRGIAGISILALLAATGFGVAAAFAHLAREEAFIAAYQEAASDAALAAGGNPGPDWETLLETEAGRRRLALWFDTMRGEWPAACAARMAQVNQSSAACLPESGFLQALIEARLDLNSFAALAENAAANASEQTAAPSREGASWVSPGRETTTSDAIAQDRADALAWAPPPQEPTAYAADPPPAAPTTVRVPRDAEAPSIEAVDGIVAPPPAQAPGEGGEPAPALLHPSEGERLGSRLSLLEPSGADPSALEGAAVLDRQNGAPPGEALPTTGRWSDSWTKSTTPRATLPPSAPSAF